MIIIKVGEGRSSSGKILDHNTQWYAYNKIKSIDERKEAIEYAISTKRDIYISGNKKSYRKVTPEQLMNL